MHYPWNKKIFLYWSWFITVIGLYFLGKELLLDNGSSMVFWPASYFISLWALFLIFSNRDLRHRSNKKLLGKEDFLFAIFFGVAFYMLYPLSGMLLERLFDLEEQLKRKTFSVFLANNIFLIVEGGLFYLGFVLFSWVGFYREVYEEEKMRGKYLEKAFDKHSLNALNKELNPHFLFNAMHNVMMLIRLKKSEKALSGLASLNHILRIVLKKNDRNKISLREESELLNEFLSVEMLRFGDKIKYIDSMDELTMDLLVPPLILQPLIENAFKHGLGADSSQELTVQSKLEGQNLRLSVFNTRSDHERIITVENGHGIGLSNTISRLRRLYGGYFTFQTFEIDDSTEFRIIIPAEAS